MTKIVSKKYSCNISAFFRSETQFGKHFEGTTAVLLLLATGD